MCSQVVEDCFQRCTGLMNKASNLKAQDKRIWAKLIESSVLEGSHSFNMVKLGVLAGHTRRPKLETTTFSPKLRTPSIEEAKKIVGYEDRPKWYSPGAHTLPQRFTDLEVMRCTALGLIEARDVGKLWLGSLLRYSHKLLVRRTHCGELVGQ